VTTPDLATTLAGLRELLAEERHAIAKLDVALLEALTARKRELVQELGAAGAGLHAHDPVLGRLIMTARVELGANAALIAAACEAVSAALGIEPSASYGRTARTYATTRPMRIIAG
jgi:hypothetical protein